MSNTESNIASISFLASLKSAVVADGLLVEMVFGVLGLPGIVTVTALAGLGGPWAPADGGGGGGGGGGALEDTEEESDVPVLMPSSRKRSSACFSKSSLMIASEVKKLCHQRRCKLLTKRDGLPDVGTSCGDAVNSFMFVIYIPYIPLTCHPIR